MSQLVSLEHIPPIAIMTIDRPDVLNAYNEELLDCLKKKLEEAFAEETIKVLIITGRGNKSFCVGADIDWLEKLSPEQACAISKKGHLICNMIEKSSKVVIAAINGYALGGGMEIALACDLRIGSTRARFGQPEVGLGLIPGFDGTQRLPEIVGVAQAKEVLFTGNIIDAEEAYEKRLVNKVVTPRDLLRESKKIALGIAEQSFRAVGLIKEAIYRNSSEFETDAFSSCFEDKERLARIKELKHFIHE